MPSEHSTYLKTLLETACQGLPDVTWRRMFGCDAVFARGHIFGLVWKKDRIGLKYSDQKPHQTLLSMPGAEPWSIGNKTMSAWVLIPESFHDDEEQLLEWVKKAHMLAHKQEIVKKKKR